ncbi:hypothetical protein PRZ48_002313 [Zasmidium cellare]|uniref:Piwi domain-containing protein n=1 Tax=Zasmidium cellare TaxID=395010 RepID=A0ABR0F4R6_ZASCE|nr:hypothetical protein PRZ48_002313 [Zasmidium cellare]
MPGKKGKKKATKPCIRCPTRPVADICQATNKKDLSKCHAEKDNNITGMWRGFTDAEVDDLSTVLPSTAECQAAIDQAIGIDEAARATVGSDNYTNDDAFEEAVTQEIANQNAQYSPNVPLSKQLLEYAFVQVHRTSHGGAKAQDTVKQKTKSSAQNSEPESSTTSALQELTIGEKTGEPTDSNAAGGSEVSKVPDIDGKVDIAHLDLKELPLKLCNRCPTPEIALHNVHHCGDLQKCMKDYRRDATEPGKLWWMYKDEPDQTTPDIAPMLATEPTCQKFLAMVEERNQAWIAEAQKKYPGDLQGQISYVCLERANQKHEGPLITRQMLEHAANTCYGPPVDDSPSDGGADDQLSAQDAPAEQAPPPNSWGSSSLDVDGKANKRKALKVPSPTDIDKSGAKRAKFEAAKATNTGIVTNHFKVTIKKGVKLYEYQVIGLLNTSLNLSAPRKKALLRRLIKNSKVLDSKKDSFAYNKEGRIIAWEPLTPDLVKDQAIELLDISDFSREKQGGVAARQIQLDLVFKRVIELDEFVAYAQGKNPTYAETGTAQALDILIGHAVTQRSNNTVIGQNSNQVFQIGNDKFFPSTGRVHDFGQWGMIAMRGFSSNMKAGQASVLLNVNTAFSTFYRSQTVAEYLNHFALIDRKIPFDNDAAEHLKGLRVYIMYDRSKPGADPDIDLPERRTKTITGFSTKPAHSQTFKDEKNDKDVKVWDYFKREFPAAAAKSDSRYICVNTGGVNGGKPCWYLPDQLMVLPGQIYRHTLEGIDKIIAKQTRKPPKALTATMIDFAGQAPQVNRDAIEGEGLTALDLQKGQNEPAVLRNAGIKIERTMMDVEFKKLPRPTVVYGPPKGTTVREKGDFSFRGKPATWTSNSKPFYTTTKAMPNGVTFLHLPSVVPAKLNFTSDFCKVMGWNGLEVNQKQVHCFAVNDGRANIAQAVGNSTADLTGIVLEGLKDRRVYADFRSVMDQTYGRPSIVLSADRILGQKGRLDGYMGGNALKVNVRLGNQNHTLQDGFTQLKKNKDPKLNCNTLVLGADLIHPKQKSGECVPSIAALVGSIDGDCATFLGSARRQQKGHEFIFKEQIESMAKDRIQAWKKKNNAWPDRILYYRDGTGNTQYGDVKKYEIEGIKKAWESCTKKSRTTLQMTTIMVIKRHNTRFYPTSDKLAVESGNIPPGTVVDRQITSPHYIDFYLQSHDVETQKKPDGTLKTSSAKPTHYFVLEHGMKLPESDLQTLTNNFCYMYSHTTKAVSYVAPAYLADKLCERAALYLRRYYDNDKEDVADMDKETMEKAIESDWCRGGQGADGNPWNANLNDKMFWM